MPDKSFNVNIYDLDPPDPYGPAQTPFDTAIQGACAQPLGDRYLIVSEKGRRLEHHDRWEGYYLLNFVTFEFAGPGRSAPETQAVPMGLQPDESFAHETAVLYDPETMLVFAESARGGMGPGAIASYFGRFANRQTDYQLIPRLDDEAGKRARRHQTIRSMTMRVAIGPVTEKDREAGIGVIKSFGDDYGAELVDIEIKASRARGRTLSLGNIWRTANSILNSSDTNNVAQLKIKGREHDDDPLETIDLLQHRERRERSLKVDDVSRKVPHELRWENLISIRQEFLV